jgi:S-DNA-T family DNA segregation ATPase FtsK/SpoIIIE
MVRVVGWLVAVLVVAGAVFVSATRSRSPRLYWYALGFPATVVRMWLNWRGVAVSCELTTTRRPPRVLVGGSVMVTGRALRPRLPHLGFPHPSRDGLVVLLRLLPGQVPEQYGKACEAMAHAWRVHAVRCDSPRRGWVRLVVLASDPLNTNTDAVPSLLPAQRQGSDMPAVLDRQVLRLSVGRLEDGRAWRLDLTRVPHWLITGATRSGKSTLLTTVLCALMPHPVALVGIDCKGGLELAPYAPRLSGLACSRAEAVVIVDALVTETLGRMLVCRQAGVRTIWDLPGDARPVPVVLAVDEVAELFLSVDKPGRDEATRVGVGLLRLAQLGAVLGDVHPDAVRSALGIDPATPGVAVITDSGGWSRARSWQTSMNTASSLVAATAGLTPQIPGVPLPVLLDGGEAR